jgi:hypothetical protein
MRPSCVLNVFSHHIHTISKETRRRSRWKKHDAYQKALDRLLRDLRVERA